MLPPHVLLPVIHIIIASIWAVGTQDAAANMDTMHMAATTGQIPYIRWRTACRAERAVI